MIYTLEFINNLISTDNLNYTLPKNIITSLNNLEKVLNNSDNALKTRNYINNKHNNNNNEWKRREKIKITQIYKPR